mgnify:CR=1 FL=1|jgi:heat-inducible transcriptional repressor
MGEERKFTVLRAIVEDYVQTHEPVGSKVIAERYQLGVSPATIRNDMAALEAAGLIIQPHTSAGRVPTEKGYRLFVDQLQDVRPLSRAERAAIERFLADAIDLDDILDRSVRLLAHLTHQVAVAAYPVLRSQVIRHIEILPVTTNRVLVVLITSSGRMDQRTFPVDEMPTETELADLRECFNQIADGRRPTELGQDLTELADTFTGCAGTLAREIATYIADTADEEREDRIVLAGTPNLARAGTDFTIHPVLEALEEQVVLLRLLTEMADDEGVAVRIGHETQHETLAGTAIVASRYGTEGDAAVAALGPTRMDYAGTISAVRAVARYMTRILAG